MTRFEESSAAKTTASAQRPRRSYDRRRPVLIFLDFDGVLRRNASAPRTFDPDCLACLEAAVRELPRARIVVTSSWRTVETLTEIRARFSPDIALRIVGLAPSALYRDDFPRHREVLAFLRTHGLEAEPWIALDDDPLHYPDSAPVILTNPELGFDEFVARRLREVIAVQYGANRCNMTACRA